MANKIKRLNAGQAPSLINAQKGNELIDKINSLTESSASAMAELGGISLKSTDSGKLELDITQETLNKLQGDGVDGFQTKVFRVVESGNFVDYQFLVKPQL